MPNRTPQEQRLLEKAGQFLPGGSNGNLTVRQDLSFLVREGRGSRIWDVSGNEYVDWLMGSGPMVLGHAHPAVVEAVTSAAGQGSTFFATNEKAVLLAEELVNAMPCAEKVRFTTSGTDACFQAMRAARSYRRRGQGAEVRGRISRHQRLRPHELHTHGHRRVSPSRAQQRGDTQGHPGPDAGGPLQRSDHHLGHSGGPPRRVGRGDRGAAAAGAGPPARLPAGPERPDPSLRHPADFRRGGHGASGWPTAAPRNSMGLFPTYARWARSWAAVIPWRRSWGARTYFRCTTRTRPPRTTT